MNEEDKTLLNPNKPIQKETTQALRSRLKKLKTHKVSEFSAWLEEHRLFVNFIQKEKYKYSYLVLSGKMKYIPNYYGILYQYFNFMIAFADDETREKYIKLFDELFPKIHKDDKTVGEAFKLINQLKDIDSNLGLLKEKYGLGLTSMAKDNIDEAGIQDIILKDDKVL